MSRKKSSGEAKASPRTLRERRLEALTDFVWGLITIGAIVALRYCLEQTTWIEGMERWVYAQMQYALASEKSDEIAKITIVDIGGVEMEHPKHALIDDNRKITPRDRILQIVKAILPHKPRLIAIDIDFSPEDGRFVDADDPHFFQEISSLSSQNQIPIYLGVVRQSWAGAAHWLGAPEFSRLAAGASYPAEPDTRFYVRWQRDDKDRQALPSMALAIAGKSEQAGDELESKFPSLVHTSESRGAVDEYGNRIAGVQSWALANYTPLASLEKDVLRVVNPATIGDNPQRFSGRAILIGDALEPQGSDVFGLGEIYPRPVPGVYLHACAAITAAGRPLSFLTERGSMALDLVISLVTLGFVFVVICYDAGRPGTKIDEKTLSGFLTIIAILIVCLAAITIVHTLRIVWTDFVAVSIGILLHSVLHPQMRQVGPLSLTFLNQLLRGRHHS